MLAFSALQLGKFWDLNFCVKKRQEYRSQRYKRMFLSFVHLNSELEITQMHKIWGLYSYSGILYSREKELTAHACGMNDLHKPCAAKARHNSQCHTFPLKPSLRGWKISPWWSMSEGCLSLGRPIPQSHTASCASWTRFKHGCVLTEKFIKMFSFLRMPPFCLGIIPVLLRCVCTHVSQ